MHHPERGFACPNGRTLAQRGYPTHPAPPEMPLCRKCQRHARRPELASIAGRTPPPWNVAMRAMLQDGEWHEIAELARLGGLKVPPNKAMAWFLDHVAPKRSPQWAEAMSTRQKVKSGRYNICVRVITDWITERVVEADRPPRYKGRRVRLVASPRLGPGRGDDGRYVSACQTDRRM